MPSRPWIPWLEPAAASLVVLACLVSGIGLSPILNGDEARFAQASREMLHHGTWVVPTVAGQPRYDKPILIYWLAAASFSLFGDNPAAARWPSALAASLAIGLLAWRARSALGPGAGWAAGLLLAATPVFFFEGRACTADAVNLLWTLAAMLSLERLMTGRSSKATALCFWVATGLAVLTKGPVAPLFIAGTGLAWWALRRRWRPWPAVGIGLVILAGALGLGPLVLLVPAAMAVTDCLKDPTCRTRMAALHPAWGLPVFGVIVFPWVFNAWRATSGDFFSIAVGHHVLARSLTALESHGGFPGFYLLTALIVCFPWFSAGVTAVRDRWKGRFHADGPLFMLAWAVGPLVVLETVQTRMIHYWLPAYPALVLLVIGTLRSTRTHWSRLQTGIHLVGGLGLAVVPLVPTATAGLSNLGATAAALGLFMAGVTLAAAFTVRRRPVRSVLVSAAGCLIFLALLFGPFIAALSDHLIGTQMTEIARQSLRDGRPVALFALKDEEVLFSLPIGTPVVESGEDVRAFLGGDGGVVLARRSSFDRLQHAFPKDHFHVLESFEGLDLGRGRWVEGVSFTADAELGSTDER